MNPAMRILYLSGSESDRLLARQTIENTGRTVDWTVVKSLTDFERQATTAEFDVILLSLSKREEGVFRFLDCVRKIRPFVPIIFIVGPELEEFAWESVQRGGTDYVVNCDGKIRRLSLSIDLTLDRARLLAERERNSEELARLTEGLERRVADRTAQLAAANQELEAFSYSVSHDLRAPLRAIEGFARILVEDYGDKLDPEAQRCLNIIIASTERMNRLIDDLLAFSRLTRTELEKRLIDMTELAQIVAVEIRRNHPGADVSVTIEPLLPARGDAAMLRQVWINLIENAFKFTRNRPKPRIEIGSYRDGANQVYYVRDNGVGFDMQYGHKLFNVFQRLHRADQFEGTGVGLAIVKRIIQRHGGQTWAEGKVNEGATFYFSVPAEARAEAYKA